MLRDLDTQLRLDMAPRKSITHGPLCPRHRGPFDPTSHGFRKRRLAAPGLYNTASVEGPKLLEGHTMIYRACTRLQALSSTDSDSDQLNDFSRGRGIHGNFGARTYFTPQREVADRCAMWFKRMVLMCEIAVLQIAVPNDMLSGMSKNFLWSEDERRTAVVRHSRTRRFCGWVSEHNKFRYVIRNEMVFKDLWEGHVARFRPGSGRPGTLTGRQIYLEQAVIHEPLEILVDGKWERSVQWAFHTFDAWEKLKARCKGKTWVHSTGRLIEEPQY